MKAAVITVSDKGYKGERIDTSGPAICDILSKAGYDIVHTEIVPDEMEVISQTLIKCADDEHIELIITTGGTGLARRDVTPEATNAVTDRLVPGISELMRYESMKITPNGCLSRGVSGIRGNSLIINLPGSKKAVCENLNAIMKPLEHSMKMLLSEGSAECAATADVQHKPSMDEWLSEAKHSENADRIGMYLTHNGIVRRTARSKVREGNADAKDVVGIDFSYDRQKVDDAIKKTYDLEGIYYVRVWLANGRLAVGDDIMYVLIGGDIRPHVLDALTYLVGTIKSECVSEKEIYV